jgi:hypothetical protein
MLWDEINAANHTPEVQINGTTPLSLDIKYSMAFLLIPQH